MKKFVSIVLVLALCLSLVACTKTEAPASSSAASSSSAAPASSSASASASATSTSKYDQADTVTFGIIASMSGDRAATGKSAKEVAEFIMDRVNKEQGGVNGKELVVVVEDDQSTDQGAANAFQKLAERGDISGIVFPIYSSGGLACEPYVAQYGIPCVANGSSVKFLEVNNPLIWQDRYNDLMAGTTMVNFIMDKYNVKNPIIMNESDTFGTGLGDAIQSNLKEKGVEVGLRITYNQGETNFNSWLAQIKDAIDKGADALFVVSQPTQAALIMEGCASTGISASGIPMIGSSSFSNAQTMSVAGKAAEGWYCTSDWTTEVDTAYGSQWVKEYRERFNCEPEQFAATFWDCLLILMEGAKISGSNDPAAIAAGIPKIKDLQGTFTIHTPDKNRITAQSQWITQIKDNVPQIVTTVSR